ncbi:Gag-Pol polyprotein, partial [Mucuna pruriens]
MATSQFPPEASRRYKEKLQSDAKYYIWDDPYLSRLYNNKCIPETETNSVLQFYHSAPGGDHYGSTRIARKVLDCGLYWPTIFRDAHHFVSTCDRCQNARMALNRRLEMPQQPIMFCEVLMFGVPKVLINDQGSHFCNKAMASLLQKYRVAHRIAIAYHPQTNDQVEVFNKEIKQALQKMINPSRKDWSRLLEDALWAHRTAYQTPLGMSPYRIVLGKTFYLLVEVEHKAY